MNRLLPLGCALAALAFPSFAGTLHVAPTAGPGVDFTSVQAAVDAASEGDEIVLHQGAYQEHVRIDGKSLVLHGEPGASLVFVQAGTQALPSLVVENLDPGQSVELRELSITRLSGTAGPGIVLADNAGHVRIQNAFVDNYDGDSLVVLGSLEVVVSGSLLQSNAPHLDAIGQVQPSAGMEVSGGSEVFVYDTEMRGSHGHVVGQPADMLSVGGDGLVVVDSSVHLFGAQVRGGGGNNVFVGTCLTPASGGAGIRVLANGGPAPLVELRETQVSAGNTGFGQPCASLPPTTAAIEGLAGAVMTLPGDARLLGLPGNPGSGGFVDVELQGGPSDAYILFASASITPPSVLPGFDGHLMIDPLTAQVVRTGVLNFGGLTLFEPSVAGVGAGTYHLQAVTVDALGGLWLTNPITLRIG